jgi:hypothetical protein
VPRVLEVVDRSAEVSLKGGLEGVAAGCFAVCMWVGHRFRLLFIPRQYASLSPAAFCLQLSSLLPYSLQVAVGKKAARERADLGMLGSVGAPMAGKCECSFGLAAPRWRFACRSQH